MANFLECVRSRRPPPVDVGYRTAVVPHLANLGYRARRRVTLQEALAGAAQ